MRRRDVLAALCGTLASGQNAVLAQPLKPSVVGFLGLASAASHSARTDAFRAGLRDLGYAEGKNILFESRWAEGHYDRLPALAADLLRRNVDVIVTHAVPGALAAKQATSTIPIVIAAIGDILDFDLISSLSRPGGNLTGLTFFNPELSAKRLELLKEALPDLSKAAVLLNSTNPAKKAILVAMERTATALSIDLRIFEIAGPGEFEGAFAAMANQQIGAVVVHEDPMLNANAQALARLGMSRRLPMAGFPELASADGLLAYGIRFRGDGSPRGDVRR